MGSVPYWLKIVYGKLHFGLEIRFCNVNSTGIIESLLSDPEYHGSFVTYPSS